MESGLVIVQPGRSIGLHSTKGYEEAIVVFSGNGEMRIPNGRTLKLRPNSVAYCPTNTEHDIFNTGSTPLKYLYVAAKVVN
jgi:mannose-6-phosphate isomerase-like protein (cupin superfamily)